MKHMSHCHATVLLGHDGFIFLINLAKYIVNLMVVHLLIYLTPVIPVNIQVLRCMLSQSDTSKAQRWPLSSAPSVASHSSLNLQCLENVFQAHFLSVFLLFLFISATLFVFSYFLATLSLPGSLQMLLPPWNLLATSFTYCLLGLSLKTVKIPWLF